PLLTSGPSRGSVEESAPTPHIPSPSRLLTLVAPLYMSGSVQSPPALPHTMLLVIARVGAVGFATPRPTFDAIGTFSRTAAPPTSIPSLPLPLIVELRTVALPLPTTTDGPLFPVKV